MRALLQAIGEDPDREGLQQTPRRIGGAAKSSTGLHEDPADLLGVTYDEEHQEMVILRDIHFESMCEHHLLPFHGVAHVGYVPRGRIVGISKLARAVEALARRPQVQERLTSRNRRPVDDAPAPRRRGRGADRGAPLHDDAGRAQARQPGRDSANRGGFREREATRLEFLALIENHRR